MKNPKPESTAVVIAKPIKVPTLKTGDDAEVAQKFNEMFRVSQNGLRSVVAFGLFAEEVKLTKLKHGQFKAWVNGNFPDISYRSVASHMQLASTALEAAGIKSLKGFFKSAALLHFSHGGDLLTLPEKGMAPEALEMRAKICGVIDGKSARQLFAEFKQADDDEENLNPKRGRLKGKGGASAAQRARAKAKEEAAEIEAMEIWADETKDVIREQADDKHWGRISDKKAEALLEAFETGADYLKALIKRRKSGKGGDNAN